MIWIWIGAFYILIVITCFRIAGETIKTENTDIGVFDVIAILLWPLSIIFLGVITFFSMLRGK